MVKGLLLPCLILLIVSLESTLSVLQLNSSLRLSSINKPSFVGSNKPYKIVCYYYAVEAWYRTSRGMFLPEDIDASKCTHIHYAYTVLNSETLLMEPSDKWAEIDNRFYERVIALKESNQGLKILLSIGGWSEQSDKFSTLISERLNRKAFIDHAVTFLLLHGFDGLDLAWFYPVCWNGDCRSQNVHSEDRENFGHFVRELKDAFDQSESRLLVTATVSGDPMIAKRSYDFTALSRLDYINVMTFDYVAHWNQMTGHQSPLFSQPGFPVDFNANSSLHLYMSRGIPSRKLVLGFPSFARSFTLVDSNDHGIGAAVKGPGDKGEFTLAEGLLAFYEICDRIQKKGWKLVRNSENELFYTYYNNQWASFDHPFSAALKAQFVKQLNLGGIMMWDIDRDDFHGNCFGIKFPLLTAINSILVHGKSVKMVPGLI
uniref:Chitinase 5 n=1 Tax=Tetranychus cinnabarinus TaxID=93129 RepID=A0A1W6KYZ8_TETCI|nr:chitinase 5 [Tetranychus cinnabarinus]